MMISLRIMAFLALFAVVLMPVSVSAEGRRMGAAPQPSRSGQVRSMPAVHASPVVTTPHSNFYRPARMTQGTVASPRMVMPTLQMPSTARMVMPGTQGAPDTILPSVQNVDSQNHMIVSEGLFEGLLASGHLVFSGEALGLSTGTHVLAEVVPDRRVAQARPAKGQAATGGAPERVELEVMVVYATNEKKGFDPRLNRFKKQLSILAFTGFDLVSKEKFMLAMDETKKTALFQGKEVETTLVSGDANRVQLRLRLLKPSPKNEVLLNTQLSIPRNGSFFLGGPKYKSGVLILPVTARY